MSRRRGKPFGSKRHAGSGGSWELSRKWTLEFTPAGIIPSMAEGHGLQAWAFHSRLVALLLFTWLVKRIISV